MPKGIPKADKTAEALFALAEAIKGLEIEVKALKPQDIPSAPKAEVKIQEVESKPESVVPFPVQWRNIIDTTLNAEFLSEVEYRPDAKFQLTIIVPKKYSNATTKEWDIAGMDRRIKIIENHLGEIGVKTYCEQIAKHLGPDIMNRVIEDRAKLVHA